MCNYNNIWASFLSPTSVESGRCFLLIFMIRWTESRSSFGLFHQIRASWKQPLIFFPWLFSFVSTDCVSLPALRPPKWQEVTPLPQELTLAQSTTPIRALLPRDAAQTTLTVRPPALQVEPWPGLASPSRPQRAGASLWTRSTWMENTSDSATNQMRWENKLKDMREIPFSGSSCELQKPKMLSLHQDQNLGNWQVKRQVGSGSSIFFKFPVKFTLKAGHRVTVSSHLTQQNHLQIRD